MHVQQNIIAITRMTNPAIPISGQNAMKFAYFSSSISQTNYWSGSSTHLPQDAHPLSQSSTYVTSVLVVEVAAPEKVTQCPSVSPSTATNTPPSTISHRFLENNVVVQLASISPAAGVH